MALGATLYRINVELSDVDRGVYQTLDLRAARHPSESMRYLLARVVALCLYWEEGIAFTRGLSTTDEPAVWGREPDGRVRLWIDVGQPRAERLHRASKHAERVVVCTYSGLAALRRSVAGERIHRADAIEVLELPPALLDALEPLTERDARWEVLHNGGHLYVTCRGQTVEGAVQQYFRSVDSQVVF
jgi:uncharacterized protein YaeQ